MKSWKTWNLDNPPPLNKMRAIARDEGLEIREGRSKPVTVTGAANEYVSRRTTNTGRLWLVKAGTNDLASPRRGLSLTELWTLLALPADDPRAQAVWQVKPQPEELDEWEFSAK